MRFRKQLEKITPYVPGKLKEGAIKLASNENPYGSSNKLKKSLPTILNDIHIYPDANCTLLKEKLSGFYRLSPEQFIVGNGSDEILLFIAGALLESGDNVVTSEMTFPEYNFATILFNGEVKTAPMQEGRFDLNAIAKLIDNKTKVAFLCNPNNPTGTFFSQNELELFLKEVPKDVMVVLDEAYYEYVTDADFPNSLELLKTYQNLIIMRTFSKIYGLAGLRVGYTISSPQIVQMLNKAREPFNVNSFAQRAAVISLEDQEFVKMCQESCTKEKDFLYRAFENMGLKYFSSQTNFVFFEISKDPIEIFQKMMELGVTIRPMKTPKFNAIRVTVGTHEQNVFFLKILKDVLGKN